MTIIENGENYTVEKDGETVDLRYQSSRGKLTIQFNSVGYGADGFKLKQDGQVLGTLYEEWGQEDGGWYFIPRHQYQRGILDVEVRIPEQAVYAAVEAVRSNKISGDAQKEFQLAKEDN